MEMAEAGEVVAAEMAHRLKKGAIVEYSDKTTVAGTLGPDSPVRDLLVADGEPIPWTEESFGLPPR